MNKLPWFKFYPADWIKGTLYLSPAERSAWINLLAHMWEFEPQGQVTGTWEEIARMICVDRLEALPIIKELERKKILEISECNAHVTLMSRRMLRLCNAMRNASDRVQKHRESVRLRVKRFRNANVTLEKSEDRRQKTDKEEEKKDKKEYPPKSPAAIAPIPPHVQFVERFKTAYESMSGQPFKADRHDFVISARLISVYGLDMVITKVKTLGVMCRDRSAWFTKEGWGCFTIGTLSNKWNSILEDAVVPTAEEQKKREFFKHLKKAEGEREQLNDSTY